MTRTIAALALGFAMLVADQVHAQDTGPGQAKFTKAQLEEMVAPIALYPDDVLSQVFIASTYPLEIVEADRWRKNNPTVQGADLDKALAQQDWDPSVKSLTAAPEVLDRMSSNLNWTKDLGDAFLGQREDLMQAVQTLRGKAYDAGTLKTTPQQTVVRENQVVQVQPADPQVVYVPTYQPAAVYGPTYAVPATPYYPSFWGTPAGAATTGVVSFGAGMATGALIGSAFNWGSNDVYVNRNWGGAHGFHGNANVNKNVDINKNVNVQKWEYDPQHRRGVGYRDPAVAKRYSGRDQLAAGSRPDHTHVRGFEPGTANRRPPGGGGGPGQGGPGQSGGQPATRAAGKNPPSRPNRPSGGGSAAGQRTANRPAPPRPAKPNDAFGDVGRGARDASRRGAASRGVPSRAGNGGSGQPRRSGGGGGGGGGGHGGGGGGGRGGRRH